MAVEQTILNEDMEVDQRIVNEERYENENGEHMESNVFVTYSDHNLAEIYASLIDKNDNDLKKLLPSLICDTETYVHDLEKEGKGFAFKIKGHYLDFHKHAVCNFKSDKVIMKGIKRLEKLWKMLDIFYDFDQMEDKQAEKQKNKLKNVTSWFNENTDLFTEHPTVKNITLTFLQAGIKYMNPNLVMATIDMLKKQGENIFYKRWKRKLYTFDDGCQCCVVFHNDEYFVDQYGNFFEEEGKVFQFMSRLCANIFFTSQNGENRTVLLNLDYDFLYEMLPYFKRIEKEFTFANFIADMKGIESEGMDALLQMKAFCRFFCELDDTLVINGKKIRAYFSLTGKNINISFCNLTRFQIQTKTFFNNNKDFEMLLKNLESSKQEFKYTSYKIIVEENVNSVNADELNYLAEDFENCIESPFTHNYMHVCFQTAEKLLKYIKSTQPYKNLRITWDLEKFKYIAFWVALKCKNEAEAIINFTTKEMKMKKEFSGLMIAILKCKKSKNHTFSNEFSASFHFEKHYKAIRDILQTKISQREEAFPEAKDFPELNNRNKRACATYFLQCLPDFVFDGVHKLMPGRAKNGLPCQLYVFEKPELGIKGVKSKTLDINNNPVEGFGNTNTEIDCLKDTFIKNICEITPSESPTLSQNISHDVSEISPRRGPKRKAKRTTFIPEYSYAVS